MKIIGLYAPVPRSGKSTLARMLTDTVNYEDAYATTIKFADALNNVIVPIVGEFLEGGEDEAEEWLQDWRRDRKIVPELSCTMRHMQQTLGTGWGRETVHPDLWVLLMRKRLRRYSNAGLVVIDDVRFENEYALVKKLGGIMIRIERPDAPETAEHVSNARLEGYEFDYTIINNSTEADLNLKALAILWKEGLA
jgi:hypothetical protein